MENIFHFFIRQGGFNYNFNGIEQSNVLIYGGHNLDEIIDNDKVNSFLIL